MKLTKEVVLLSESVPLSDFEGKETVLVFVRVDPASGLILL